MAAIEEKPQITAIDDAHQPRRDADAASVASIDKKQEDRDIVQLKSEHDDLGTWATVWRFRKAVTVCTLLCIAAAADGYQINLNGAVIANYGFMRLMGNQNAAGQYTINAQHNALWGALQSLGQMIAMVGLNPISDRIGRKWTLYALWCILFGSLMMETFVKDWKMWAGAKLLAGMGVGAIQSTLPVYITEWSPNNIRGTMVLAYGIWNNFGNFMAPVVLSISEKIDPMDYKTPILTQWVFLGIMLPIFLYLPETPSYYAARGLHEGGVKVMKRINGNVVGYNCEQEYGIIVNTIEEERRMKHELGLEQTGFRAIARSYVDCFRGTNRMRTLACAIPTACQQLNALSLLNVYGALFFRQAGMSDAFAIKAILTSMKIVGVLFAIALSDKYGRRPIVCTGAWWAWAMLVVVAAGGDHISNPHVSRLVIGCACMWSIGSGALGALGWTFIGEVSSQRLRARTAGLAAGIGVIFGLTFNTSVPIMIDANGRNLGFKAVWIFVGLGGIVNVIALFFCPEPARRSPAELDELYEKHVPAWRMRKYVTEVERNNDELRAARGRSRGAAGAGEALTA